MAGVTLRSKRIRSVSSLLGLPPGLAGRELWGGIVALLSRNGLDSIFVFAFSFVFESSIGEVQSESSESEILNLGYLLVAYGGILAYDIKYIPHSDTCVLCLALLGHASAKYAVLKSCPLPRCRITRS